MQTKITTRKTANGGTVRTLAMGNQRVDIYAREHNVKGSGYTRFAVADFSAGVRRLRSFNDLDSAIAEAESIARKLTAGDAAGAQMDSREAASYGRSVQLLKAKGVDVPLEIVAAHFAEAFKILGGDRIVEAAKDSVRRNPQTREPRTVAEVADEMIAMKEKRGSGSRYLEDLRGRLGGFAKAFAVDVATITGPDVQSWLDGMKGAPRTVKNFRSNVSQLFKFAESRGYIARGENPVAQTEQIKTKNADAVTIFSPDELNRLIAAAPDAFKPVIALQAFAGLRSAEVARLDWRDVKLTKGHIEVAADKAKTASRRLVPIVANLAEWLAPHAATKGKIWKHSRAYYHEAQRDTAGATAVETNAKRKIQAQDAVEWKHNALRHSFISYRLAEIQNVAQVALEAGNSPGMIFQHYRELVTASDAKAWFAIKPELPANVTPIAKGVKAA